MRIAATTSRGGIEDIITPQFGRAATFTIVEFDEGVRDVKVVRNAAASQASGAGIAASQLLIDSGVEILLTGNVGPKAMNVLRSAGIKIYRADGMSVRKALDKLSRGELEEITTSVGMGRGMGMGGGGKGRGGGGMGTGGRGGRGMGRRW